MRRLAQRPAIGPLQVFFLAVSGLRRDFQPFDQPPFSRQENFSLLFLSALPVNRGGNGRPLHPELTRFSLIGPFTLHLLGFPSTDSRNLRAQRAEKGGNS